MHESFNRNINYKLIYKSDIQLQQSHFFWVLLHVMNRRMIVMIRIRRINKYLHTYSNEG